MNKTPAPAPKPVLKAPPIAKHSDLRALFDQLREEKEELMAVSTPLRAERDSLLASIQPTLDAIKALEKQVRVIEQPRLADLDNQIGALARAMGGRSMSNESK